MRGFIETIRSSFYDPVFYQTVRTQPLRPAIKLLAYLGMLGIGLSMLLAIPALLAFAHSNLPQAVEDAYPNDLVVTIAGGQMSINQPQPYSIKNTLPILSGPDAPAYIAIFDASDTLPDDLQQASTLILVKEKYAVTPGQNNSQQIISFSRISTTTIDKSTIQGLVEKVQPYFVPAVEGGGVLLFIIFTIVGALFWVLAHMFYVLFPALLVYFFMMLKGVKAPYRESYMIALYASIPVSILFYIVFSLLLQVPAIPFAYTLVLLLCVIFNTAGHSRESSTP